MSFNKNKKTSNKIRKMSGGNSNDFDNIYPPTTDDNNIEQLPSDLNNTNEPMTSDLNRIEILSENDIIASTTTDNQYKKDLNNIGMVGGKKIKRKSNKKQISPKKSIKQRVSKNKRKSKNNKN
jgi:hypothetical protein